jgi:hypothetical protein
MVGPAGPPTRNCCVVKKDAVSLPSLKYRSSPVYSMRNYPYMYDCTYSYKNCFKNFANPVLYCRYIICLSWLIVSDRRQKKALPLTSSI